MTQILIDIQSSIMRVYQTEAAERGYASGQEFIAALLADWPAILAPAPAPAPEFIAVTQQDNPFGGGF